MKSASSILSTMKSMLLNGRNKKYIFVYCFLIFLFDTFVRNISLIGAGALAVAVIPWVFEFIKSIEMPGGFKLELNQFEKRIENELLPPPVNVAPNNQHVFLDVYETDPLLAIAGLRIEIEKRLRKLAEIHQISGRNSVASLLRDLQSRQAIGPSIASIINDMLPTLNRAVHAQDIPADAGDWVLKNGPSILAALDEKI